MKLYGSLSRLVSILFRKNSQDITVRPNQGTTYSASRDIQLPAGDSDHVLVSRTSTDTLTNKSIDADSNTITNIDNADIKSGAAIDAAKIHDGSVSNTEFGYLDGVTSSIQTQLNNKQPLDATLTALAAYNTNGFLVQTAADTFAGRSLSAGTAISISNSDGVAGNPSISVDQSAIDHGSIGGLGDDDHTQYILVAGTRAFSGNQSMGGNKLTNLANGTASGDAVNYSQLSALSSIIQNFEWQPSALSIELDSANITSPTTGDRYLIAGTGLNDFDGHDNEIAEWDGAAWVFTSPSVGMFISVDDESDRLYNYGGTSWDAKYFEATTASTGLTKVGFDIRLDSSSAGSGLGFSSGVLSVNVDGSTLEINTDTLRVKDAGITLAKLASNSVDENKLTTSVAGSGLSGGGGSALSVNVDNSTIEISADTLQVKDGGITNAKVASGIDAVKIADGSVSNTEFQYLDGVSSGIQGQLDGMLKLAGRSSGQTAYGGTGSGEHLKLGSTAHATKGAVIIHDGSKFLVDDPASPFTAQLSDISGIAPVFLNTANANANMVWASDGDGGGNFIRAYNSADPFTAPTSLLSGSDLWNIQAYSYASATSESYVVGQKGVSNLSVFTTENHSTTARGTGFKISTVTNGTTQRRDRISVDGTGQIVLGQSAITGNHLIFANDNANDIGASGATRPRTAYLGTSLVSPLVSLPSNGQTTSLQGSASASASVTYSLPPADGSSGYVLSTNGSGVLSWVSNASSASFTATWVNADGASKTVTHSLGSTDVLVQLYDIDSGEQLMVDSVVRTDSNTVDLTSSEAPDSGGSGWKVVIIKA